MADIRSLLSRRPVTVDRSTTVRDAAREMEREGVGALLVVEARAGEAEETGDAERLVGIVTDRDIVLRGVARDVSPDGRVDALMTTEVITVPAGVDVERAHEIFREHAIRRLPVVDGRRLVGLLSVDDLLVRAEREMAELVHPLADEAFAPHHEAPTPAIVGDTARAPEAGAPGAGVPPSRKLRAQPGDTLVVHRPDSRQPDRFGEIFQVRTAAGEPPFAVRWSDTGHVSFVYPGPNAEVRRRGQPAGSRPAGDGRTE